ncbi:MAG: hypothetical protein ACRD16_01135 [Thermoanaerobaculia bacterium]
MNDRPSIAELALRIESDLAELARRIHEDLFGAGRPAPGLFPVRLELRLPVSREANKEAPTLTEQLSRDVREAGSLAEPFRPGHVFCYRCESPDCEHSSPLRPQSVCAGYGPTGQPQWSDLSQALLEARHERVGELFERASRPLALVQMGHGLKGRLLRPFGKASKRYDLLGQLVAGYFGGGNDPLFAVTVQAVETRGPDGSTRLHLNRIGPAAARYFDEQPGHWFLAAFSEARTRLSRIEDRLASPDSGELRSDRMRRIPGILHDLRRAVERAGRQSERRTRHAADRRRDNRPTHAAVRDALRAPDESLLADESRGTLIVLGPNGRAHAFTPAGRLVTSLTLDREALDRRLHRERWRRATREEIRSLRESLPRP